jgi:hypothetical protein
LTAWLESGIYESPQQGERQMTERGYVSMRNEDGTQWAVIEEGRIQWTDRKREAGLISRTVFNLMEGAQESTRTRDCPDRGFFGVYNLRFHPV